MSSQQDVDYGLRFLIAYCATVILWHVQFPADETINAVARLPIGWAAVTYANLWWKQHRKAKSEAKQQDAT